MCIVSEIEIKDIANKSTDAINFDEENIFVLQFALISLNSTSIRNLSLRKGKFNIFFFEINSDGNKPWL